jgi:hypothetical protein
MSFINQEVLNASNKSCFRKPWGSRRVHSHPRFEFYQIDRYRDKNIKTVIIPCFGRAYGQLSQVERITCINLSMLSI